VLETRANPLRVPHLSLLYAEVRSFPCRTMRLESCFTVVWNGRVSHGTSTTTDLPRMWSASGFSAGSKGTAVLVLQLPFPQVSESMGNHDSKIVDAASVD
jgi:hypothetical protein